MSILSFLGLDGRARSVSKAEPLPVDIGTNVSVTMGAEVEVKNDTGNPVPTAPNVQQGSGAITASTTRVTLATDGPGVANLASIAGLAIPAHDNIALTYRTSGNGTGKIDQVIYKTGATTVGTLTLAYDSSNRLSTVTKS